MKILLVKPYNLSDHIQPSLGLGYLATAIRDNCRVKILDCIKDNIRISRFTKIINKYKPDLVGIQCYTFDLRFIKEALAVVKNSQRKIFTVIGGPHSSALPQETMRFFGNRLDFAFQGESEIGLRLLIKNLSNRQNWKDIPGLIWRDNGIRINSPYFENDLDKLGMPSWDLIRPETYPESQHGAFYQNFPITPIMLTRGCPYQCVFCAGRLVSGTKVRKRSVSAVIKEIRMLYNDFGIREFHVIDDNFTFDKDYAKLFLRELIAQKLNISWATPNGVRMETIDEELISLMKMSGLYLISLGIESGSNKVLKLMKKGILVDKIRENVAFISSQGIDVAGFFIIGFPGEEKKEIKETIKFAMSLNLIRANFFTYLPFPGTESYNSLAKNGELKNVDWERFYFMNAAFTPKGMKRKELRWLQRRAFLKFYLRPKILWKNTRSIKSFKHLYFLFRRFFHWIIIS